MLRRGVCFLVIMGLLAGQLATIPHAHAGLSEVEQQRHDATPHVHCVASSHATRDHSHADHSRHGATHHGDAHHADAHHGESGRGDPGHDHGHAGRKHRHRHDIGASSDKAPAGEATRDEAPRSESPSEESPSEEPPGDEAPSDAVPHDGTAVFLAVNTTWTSVGAGWDDEFESFAAPTSVAICQTLSEPTLTPNLAERHRPPDKFVGGSNIYLALRNLRI